MFAAIPALLVGGPLIDRWGRRTVSVGAGVMSAVAVAALPVLGATVGLSLVTILAAVAAGALFDAPGAAAREVARPQIALATGADLDKVNARGEAMEGCRRHGRACPRRRRTRTSRRDVVAAAGLVEKPLRWDPSAQGTARIAHAETEIAGTVVPAGATVLVLLAAASRDPAVYHRPAVFDPHRSGEPEHLTFSAGIHYCLGAALARIEGEAALRALAGALPRLAVLPGARRRRGATIRGYARLPITG